MSVINNNPVAQTGKPVYAPGLGNSAIPKDFWIQPVSGEFVMGVSKYNGTAADAIYLANLNAYAAQDVKLKLTKPVKAAIFSRETGKYVPLQQPAGELAFKLEPAGAALVRFE